ncbi:MAG: hypothetical protein K6U74_05685 [Firmicutes bacterium]|nr:hypothetical protein [Bacillota bacterium]
MDLKIESGDELIKQMLKDILVGLKVKLVQPVLEENLKMARKIEALKEQDRDNAAELKERLAELEAKVQQVPLIILAAIRDAINQAGGES